MPKDNWGTPGRDTFQLEAHEQFLSFLAADGMPFSPPYDSIQNRLTTRVQPQRIRTWKKLFEKMGILYVLNSTIRLTDFGCVLRDEILHRVPSNIENDGIIADAAISVLGHYQLDNPTNSLQYPPGTDVFPYMTVWKVMRALDNKLHWEELNRVLIRVMKMDEIPNAIDTIRRARQAKGYPEELSDKEFTALLGVKVDLPQRGRAMSAIFSEAGFGGCIIERRARADHFRHLNPAHRSLLDIILARKQSYRRFNNKKEWFDHYGRLTAKPPFKPLNQSVKNEVAIYPDEIIEGVAESYVIKGKSHRDIQKEVLRKPAPQKGGGFKAMAILHYLGLDESTKGIFKDLPTPQEADISLSCKAPWLTSQQRQRIISILEGYKTDKEVGKSIKSGYFHGETESKSLSSRRVRRQQNKLRDLLIVLYESKCALCDINDPALLIASHIVPWSVDVENRLNPSNAILLCILHDKLFENGLVSFDDDLNLVISKELKDNSSRFLREVIRLSSVFRSPKSSPPDIRFLAFHRKEVFKS